MSGDDNNDGTDTSSIKPVSSLRSRFENLNVDADKTPLPLSNRATTKAPQSLKDGPPARAQSVDSQRPEVAPPRQSAVVKEHGTLLSPTVAATPRGRPFGDARPPRPVSVGPSSLPTAPILTVQSPQSPPRPAFSARAPASLVPPPRPSSTGSVQRPQSTVTVGTTPVGNKNGPASPTLGKKAPPPVNRAAKPIISVAPTRAQTSPITSLAPHVPELAERPISPFSTPPDSPTQPTSPPKTSVLNGSPPKISFPPPPIHYKAHARRQSRASVAVPSDPRLGKHASRDISDDPDNRPALPARVQTLGTPVGPPRTSHAPAFAGSGRVLPAISPLLPPPSPERHTRQGRPPPLPEPRKLPTRLNPPPRPSEETKEGRRPSLAPQTPTTPTYLPSPKRTLPLNSSPAQETRGSSVFNSDALGTPSGSTRRDVSPRQQIRRVDTDESEFSDALSSDKSVAEYPDFTQANRRPPRSQIGVDRIWTHYDTRLLEICGSTVCTSGYMTRAWDVTTGKMTMDLAREEREVKVLSLIFKPGASADDEGQIIWTGDSYGIIQEIDLTYNEISNSRHGAHGRADIVKMHRFQNTIWTIDNQGSLLAWPPNDKGVPDLDMKPRTYRVAKGHVFSIIAGDKLWFANGKEIRVYDPTSADERLFQVLQKPLLQPGTGDVTSGAALPNQLDRVYFGHSDGKVSIYSTESFACISVVNVSTYRIMAMVGVGPYLWAGFSTGYMFVYDMTSKPWKVKKEWKAHDNPVATIVVDRSSVWKFGELQVASLGLNNCIKLWDGMLEDDWIENEMHDKDIDYCDFHEVKGVVVTWNAGASTPTDLRYDQKDENFFREVIQPGDPPDILVFGFQELVDLEDKGLTAKNLFKGRHKHKPNQDSDHLGRQYRAWRDFLVQNLQHNMPSDVDYTLVKTGNLVGLFSCIFVKSTLSSRVRDVHLAQVKRGMGGLYGNKGAILIRFILESTSFCFINCHLAAGQKETLSRNNDATAILESAVMDHVPDPDLRLDALVGGGDGTMIMDHEICVLNGDLNYRIDTMGRDSVVKTIQAGNLDRLLERDQLLLSRRRNPALRLRCFREDRITFAPTYKYDVHSDRYDSSEKNRSPAWCDRILYRGAGRVKMLSYRRHDCRTSDHRPVSGTLRMRIKSVDPVRRKRCWQDVQARLVAYKMGVAQTIRLDYLVNVLGVAPAEAGKLIKA